MAIENYIDTETGLRTLEKTADTDRVFDIDLSGEMRPSDTLSSFDSFESTNLGKVAGSSQVSISGLADNNAFRLQARISGGTAGESYRLKYTATTTAGDILSGNVLLKVT